MGFSCRPRRTCHGAGVLPRICGHRRRNLRQEWNYSRRSHCWRRTGVVSTYPPSFGLRLMILYSIKTLVTALKEPYDLIFIDADKTSYPTYLSLILSLSKAHSGSTRLLRKDGIILADNILRRGLIADSSAANPVCNSCCSVSRPVS
jgi:hypothetical protein